MSDLHAIGATREDARGDVVFVHGLGGDWRGTWTADRGRSDAFWPGWLAADLPEANVRSLAYEASPSGWLGPSMPLVDRATDVLGALEAEGLGDRPLVFVAHSLGGLLVKQMLRTGATLGERRWREIARQVRGVAFLATPHTGVKLADYVGALGTVLRASVSVRELEASAPALRELNLWFRNNARKLRVDSLLFFETRDTRGVRVVDEASADAGLEDVVPRAVDADHITIAKPASPAAVLPKLVKAFVRRCLTPPQQPDTSNADLILAEPVPSGDAERSGVANWQLPTKPDRCFGREDSVAGLVAAILEPTATPAIVLGGAGVGKTTVALAAATHPSIVERFGARRCFVPLEQAQSAPALIAALHEGLGLSPGRATLQTVESTLAEAPALLVLDNLETPWERQQGATEKVLAQLAAIPGAALLASVRSGDAPLRPQWGTRLEVVRLAAPADEQLLRAIAPHISPTDALLPSVLAALDGLPLAIELFAAQADGLDALEPVWCRWQQQKVAMLEREDGSREKQSSLAVSLEFSLHSPRMTLTQPGHEHAPARLYAMLGRLPDGLPKGQPDTLLPGCGPDALSRLLKTRLARMDGDRVRMLQPVREHAQAQPLAAE